MAKQTKAARPETARVLLFDVECSPNIGYTWGRWEQTVIEFIKERQIICFSYEWLDTGEFGTLALPDFPGYKKNPDDNKALIRALHALYSKADIIVGHNLDRFDDRRANTDFIKHKLPPPPPHKTVDTLKIARKHFDFNGNRLSDLGAFLGLGSKVRHGGFELWKKCLAGCLKAWAKMRRYCRGDVRLLKKIYLRFLPWIVNHPNMTWNDRLEGCPNCRSKNLKREGRRYTKTGSTLRFSCRDCGRWCLGERAKGRWRFW